MKTKLFSVTLKDCVMTTFTVGGPGGSGKDTSNTGVRIVHPPSGAIGVARESRSQHVNKVSAFDRMGRSKKFQVWAKAEASRRLGEKTVEERVDALMAPVNLRFEVYENGEWKEMGWSDYI